MLDGLYTSAEKVKVLPISSFDNGGKIIKKAFVDWSVLFNSNEDSPLDL